MNVNIEWLPYEETDDDRFFKLVCSAWSCKADMEKLLNILVIREELKFETIDSFAAWVDNEDYWMYFKECKIREWIINYFKLDKYEVRITGGWDNLHFVLKNKITRENLIFLGVEKQPRLLVKNFHYSI